MNFYHGTSANNLPNILQQGLIPRAGKGGDEWVKHTDPNGYKEIQEGLKKYPDRQASIYLTALEEIAEAFADWSAQVNNSRPVILQVDPKGIPARHLIQDEAFMGPGFRCTCAIPPKFITVIRAKDSAATGKSV